MATSYFQDPFGAADYSAEGMPSLLSLSNLESLGRGSVAGLLGLPEDLRKMLVTKKMQENMDFLASQSGIPQVPYFLPSSEELKQRTPRMTAPTPQAGLLEDIGAFMSPVPAAAAVKPLARGGKAVARMAGQEITDVMSGMPSRSLLGAITPQGKLLDVYHGTPHTLPPTPRNPLGEFDASKIGTGEGSQAYGYGIYTAEAPAVANRYKLAEATYKTMQGGLTNKQEFVSDMLSQGRPEMSILDLYAQKYGGSFDDAMKDLIDVKEIYKKSGNLYKVDLPDEKIATMLDWDKPLIEQNQNVLSAAKKLGFAYTKPQKLSYEDKWALFDKDGLYDIKNPTFKTKKEAQDFLKNNKTLYPDITGADFHDSISTKLNQFGGNDKKTAELLNSYGVSGIKYFDEASREAGQGTRNFVTFPGEEKSMTILERNGMRGLLD